jgi:hypothetical protein
VSDAIFIWGGRFNLQGAEKEQLGNLLGSAINEPQAGEARAVASFVGTAEIGFVEAWAGFSNVRWFASIVLMVPSMNPAFPQKHW